MYFQPALRGIGDAPAPAPTPAPASWQQAIDGAKAWMSPTAALSEIKGAFTGAMPAPARLAGLAIVPLALLGLLLPSGKRRR